MRRPHFLPVNRSNELPSACIWFDTETKCKLDQAGRQIHRLWFGYACYQRRLTSGKWTKPDWIRFEDLPTFWEWVNSKLRPKTRLFLFAHNGAFDLPVMGAFTELPKMGYKLKSAVADAPPLILTWRGEKKTIKFIDTLNIWRMPLETLGKSIGHEKLPMPPKNACQEEWDKYGKQDVEVIRRAVLAWFKFLAKNDLGGFSATLASQSFNAYRHRFMKHKIFIDANEKALDLSRSAYVGGRTECFRIGKFHGEFYYLDINSMYPLVMHREHYPVRLVGVYKRPTKKELEAWAKDFILIADCTVKTTLPIYPKIHNKKLVFPIGQFDVVLAHPEYCEAVKRGHIKEVRQVVVYQKERIFKDYINFMYQFKEEAGRSGRDTDKHFYKIMMNSLYGKFGQRGRRYETVGECDPNEIMTWTEIDLDTKTVIKKRRFGGLEQEWIDESESRYSFPAIAAIVTSHARLLLWEAIEKAGVKNVYYCDTDSIVVNRSGFNNLDTILDDNKLGAWALESTLKEVEIYGAKDYRFDGKGKTKGVRKNATWLSSNKVRQDTFMGLKGLLQEGFLAGAIVYQTEKELTRQYNKGIVTPQGKVKPLRFRADSG